MFARDRLTSLFASTSTTSDLRGQPKGIQTTSKPSRDLDLTYKHSMEQQLSAPVEIFNVIRFLRGSKSGLKNRVGVLNGSRREYFKGKSAIKALQSPAYAKLKNVPPVNPEDDSARDLLHSILRYAFYLRIERGNPSGSSSSSPKHIQVIPQQEFQPDYYYAWFYEGSQWRNYVGAVALVAVVLAGVMFPLWPVKLRIGVWYLSMGGFGIIGLFIALSIFRLIFYIITIIVASPGIWIFPKLFADVGFVESFIPVWDWDLPPPKKMKKKRLANGEKVFVSDDKKIRKRKDATASADASAAPTPPPQDDATAGPATSSGGGAHIEEVSDHDE
ncbi:Translocation protein S62 [Tulasnella sp. 403]|nr:Translocation protein S62 [Tulasnella sp. 403]